MVHSKDGEAGVDHGVTINVGNTGKYAAITTVDGSTARKLPTIRPDRKSTLLSEQARLAMRWTKFQTEMTAYRVSATIGEGLGYILSNVSFGNNTYILSNSELGPSEYRHRDQDHSAQGVQPAAHQHDQGLPEKHEGRPLMRRFLFLALATITVATAQEKPAGTFVLDTNKPYVYLAFDHVGRRTPLFEGESKQGVWLRLVNNCRIPVAIGSFDPGNHDPGIGVLHEIVPIAKAGGGGIPAST